MGKGEIARYEQFLLFPQCFQETCTVDMCKNQELTLSQTSPGFHVSAKQVFWKRCQKRRYCSSWAISPFPTVFSTHLDNFLPFSSNLKSSSATSFVLEQCKTCHLGKVHTELLVCPKMLTFLFSLSLRVHLQACNRASILKKDPR